MTDLARVGAQRRGYVWKDGSLSLGIVRGTLSTLLSVIVRDVVYIQILWAETLKILNQTVLMF